jgi:hypothetical protein
MKRLGAWATYIITAVACTAQTPIPDPNVTRLVLGDYTLQKFHNDADDVWTIQVSRSGKVVQNFGEASEPHWVSMSPVSMLGPISKQVLIEEYSGGAHCCSTFWLLDANPELRVLLDTSNGLMHGNSPPLDIDGDGISEIWIRDTTFDYFRVPYAWSPVAEICFSFDKTAQRFTPANDLCFPGIRKELDEEVAAVRSEKWKQQEDPEIRDYVRRMLVLNVVIGYFYAGHEREAWDFYDKYYQVGDRDQVRAEFLDVVSHDPFYKEMRARYERAKAR